MLARFLRWLFPQPKCLKCGRSLVVISAAHYFDVGYRRTYQCNQCAAYWSDRWPEGFRSESEEKIKKGLETRDVCPKCNGPLEGQYMFSTWPNFWHLMSRCNSCQSFWSNNWKDGLRNERSEVAEQHLRGS